MHKPIKFNSEVVNADRHDEIIDNIVSKMWGLINRDYKDTIITKLAKTLQRQNNEETVKAVYDWVVRNVPYKNDPEGVERLTAPIHFVQRNQVGGDCDDMVMMICSLLSALGIKTRIKVLAWRRKEFTHVTCEAKINGNWVELDATMGQRGYDVKRIKTGKINTVNPLQIYRQKIYNNPMKLEVQTLEDNPQIYAQAGLSGCCGGGMADCGCGGKCGKCKKTKPQNQNINLNPILIGNDFSSYLKKWASKTNSEKPQIIERERQIPIQKIVKQPVIVEKEVREPNIIIDNIERPVQRMVEDQKKLASAVNVNGTTYLYGFGY
jgi:hypothetical protein